MSEEAMVSCYKIRVLHRRGAYGGTMAFFPKKVTKWLVLFAPIVYIKVKQKDSKKWPVQDC
jgi:hypothetical protein